MSTDNQNNPNDMGHRRRGSVTQQALAGLFRSNSTSVGNGNLQATEANRRRLSISTTGIGLAGTSPTNPGVFSNGFRRGSLSTSSDSIDESAIDEDDSSRTAPTTPFVRRMSFGNPAMRGARNGGGGSPGSNGNHPSAPSNAPSHIKPPANAARRSSVNPRGGAPTGASPVRDTKNTTTSPPPAFLTAAMPSPSTSTTPSKRRPGSPTQASLELAQIFFTDPFSSRPDQGFNWSEQLRSRAESTVQGPRQSFAFGSAMSTSPPRGGPANHDRAKSVSDMPAPPAQAPQPKAPEPERQKPDHFQERILKGDFYMD